MSFRKTRKAGQVFLQRKMVAGLGAGLGLAAWASPCIAEQAVSCGGFALLGGAQINCSHVAPKQPAQVCTFSWALLTTANTTSVIEGSFLVTPGANNVTVYQGGGFVTALSNPIVLCQGKKSR